MYSCTKTCTLTGLNGYPVDVEVDLSNGMPKIILVGLADTAVKESTERVKSAIKNSGFDFPKKRITINLAPANLRKDGTQLDLAIAVSLLSCDENLELDYSPYTYMGELALDGKVNKIQGALPMVISMRSLGNKKFIIPYENRNECGVIKDVDIYPAKSLKEVVDFLQGNGKLEKFSNGFKQEDSKFELDFKDLKGQERIKRVFEISAASRINLLLVGVPGSGKTMAAKRFPSILPKLTFEESIEVSKIYSVAGLLNEGTLISIPPFRSPHHTASAVSLIGGGRIPKPGEISLSHRGVLFLDELPEFNKNVLEVLREPLESKSIHISRANASLTYPADFILVGALNPCPCGYHGSKVHECNCSQSQIERYLAKISHPLLDRIDMHLEVSEVDYKDLKNEPYGEDSETIRRRVEEARELQKDRYKEESFNLNGEMPDKFISKYCKLNAACEKIMELSFKKYGFSARTYNKLLKISRTIADLDKSTDIKEMHLLEAIRYRTMDTKYWSK